MGTVTQGLGPCRSLIFFVLLSLFPFSLFSQSFFELEKRLDLKDEQRTRIEEIRKDYLRRWQYLETEAIKRRIEIRRILNAQKENGERLERLEKELTEIERERGELLRAYRRELRKILTDEQFKAYEDFCRERPYPKRRRWR